MCRKTHENTSIGSRREEMKSLWVTAYKEQTLKQKKTHETDMEVGGKASNPKKQKRLGGKKISARKKKYKHSKKTRPPKKGGG